MVIPTLMCGSADFSEASPSYHRLLCFISLVLTSFSPFRDSFHPLLFTFVFLFLLGFVLNPVYLVELLDCMCLRSLNLFC